MIVGFGAQVVQIMNALLLQEALRELFVQLIKVVAERSLRWSSNYTSLKTTNQFYASVDKLMQKESIIHKK